MTTIAEANKDVKTVQSLPRLDKWPKLCWHNGYWDGPLNGICLFNNRPHWFDMIYEFSYEGEEEWEPGEMEIFLGRIYVVAELDEKQFSIIKDRHEVFRNYVGCHTDYNQDNKRPFMSEDNGKALIEYNWDKYKEVIDTKPKFPNLAENIVVAWWGDKQFDFDAALIRAMDGKK